jgi:hypothetical protein
MVGDVRDNGDQTYSFSSNSQFSSFECGYDLLISRINRNGQFRLLRALSWNNTFSGTEEVFLSCFVSLMGNTREVASA